MLWSNHSITKVVISELLELTHSKHFMSHFINNFSILFSLKCKQYLIWSAIEFLKFWLKMHVIKNQSSSHEPLNTSTNVISHIYLYSEETNPSEKTTVYNFCWWYPRARLIVSIDWLNQFHIFFYLKSLLGLLPSWNRSLCRRSMFIWIYIYIQHTCTKISPHHSQTTFCLYSVQTLSNLFIYLINTLSPTQYSVLYHNDVSKSLMAIATLISCADVFLITMYAA